MTESPSNPKDPMRELAAQWTRIHLAVRSFVAGIVHDSHAVEDIVQDIATTAVDKYDTFEPGTNFNAWVFAIARNRVMTYQTRSARDRHVFDDAMLARLADAHSAIADGFEERRDAMRACIDQLEGRNRRVLDMKYREQLRADRIAETEKMTVNAVYLLLSRVRRVLLECIEDRLTEGGDSDA